MSKFNLLFLLAVLLSLVAISFAQDVALDDQNISSDTVITLVNEAPVTEAIVNEVMTKENTSVIIEDPTIAKNPAPVISKATTDTTPLISGGYGTANHLAINIVSVTSETGTTGIVGGKVKVRIQVQYGDNVSINTPILKIVEDGKTAPEFSPSCTLISSTVDNSQASPRNIKIYEVTWDTKASNIFNTNYKFIASVTYTNNHAKHYNQTISSSAVIALVRNLVVSSVNYPSALVVTPGQTSSVNISASLTDYSSNLSYSVVATIYDAESGQAVKTLTQNVTGFSCNFTWDLSLSGGGSAGTKGGFYVIDVTATRSLDNLTDSYRSKKLGLSRHELKYEQEGGQIVYKHELNQDPYSAGTAVTFYSSISSTAQRSFGGISGKDHYSDETDINYSDSYTNWLYGIITSTDNHKDEYRNRTAKTMLPRGVTGEIYRVDLQVQGLYENNEETVGAVLSQQGTGQNTTSAWIYYSVSHGGSLKVEATNGLEFIINNEAVTSYTWNISEDSVASGSQYITIRTTKDSDVVRDQQIKATLMKGGTSKNADIVKVTTAYVKLTVDKVDNNKKVTPGVFVGVTDSTDNTLTKMTLEYTSGLDSGTLQLAGYFGNNMMFWKTPNKAAGTFLSSTTSWNLAQHEVPEYVYVEGLQTSQSNYIYLNYNSASPYSNISISDYVSAHVVRTAVGIGGMGDPIILRNNQEENITGSLSNQPLYIFPNLYGTATFKLTLPSNVRAWKDSGRTEQIQSNSTWDVELNGNMYYQIYLEGYGASSSYQDGTISFEMLQNGRHVHTSTAKTTVIDVNLIADNLPASEEATPGLFIGQNDTYNTATDNLVRIEIKGPTVMDHGKLRLEYNNSNIKIWTAGNKAEGTELASTYNGYSYSYTWDYAVAGTTVPRYIYLEGINAATSSLNLYYEEYPYSMTSGLSDYIVATVVRTNVGTTSNNEIVLRDNSREPSSSNLRAINTAIIPAANITKVGKVKLTLSSGVKAWTNNTKSEEISSGKTWDLANTATDPIPTYIYLEGTSLSSSYQDKYMKLEYADNHNKTIYGREVKITVVDAYLDVTGTVAEEKVTPGTFIGVNDFPENELTKVKVNYATGVHKGNLKVTFGGQIKLWSSSDKADGTSIANNKTWDLADANVAVPEFVYVEGISTGTATLTLTYTMNTQTFTDAATFTVVKTGLSSSYLMNNEFILVNNEDKQQLSNLRSASVTLTPLQSVGKVKLTMPDNVKAYTAYDLETETSEIIWDLADVQNQYFYTYFYIGGMGVSSEYQDGDIKVTYIRDEKDIHITHVKTTVVETELVPEDLKKEDKVTPGLFMPLNDDFDNGTYMADNYYYAYTDGNPPQYSTYIEDEDDLVKVELKYPDYLNFGTLMLSFGSNVKVWTDANKADGTQYTNYSKSWNLANANEKESIPQYIYLEGYNAGRDCISFDYNYYLGGNTVHTSDAVNVTIVKTNLPQSSELILKNNENDNLNANLKSFIVSTTPNNMTTGKVMLELPSNIRAWKDNTKTEMWDGNPTWELTPAAPGLSNKTLYLEGWGYSNSYQDGTLKLTYTDYYGNVVHASEIKTTVVDLEIKSFVDIIYLNSNDDDSNDHPDKDDTDIVVGENDLEALMINVYPFNMPIGTLSASRQTLDGQGAVTNGTANYLKFYKTSDKERFAHQALYPNPLSFNFANPNNYDKSEVKPNEIYLEAYGINPNGAIDDQQITVSYNVGGITITRTKKFTINVKTGDNELNFKILKSDPFAVGAKKDVLTDYKGVIGGTVYLVAEVKVGVGNRVASQQDTMKVRINDEWDGYEEGINRALKDYNFSFDGWTEYLGVSKEEDNTKDNILWANTTTNLSDVNNLEGMKTVTYYKVIKIWNSIAEPYVEYLYNGYWARVIPETSHNGKHSIKLIDEYEDEAEGVLFQEFDTEADVPGWQEPEAINFKERNVEVNNLVVKSMNVMGNKDYFVYSPDVNLGFNEPKLTFSFNHTNLTPDNHYYKVYWFIFPTGATSSPVFFPSGSNINQNTTDFSAGLRDLSYAVVEMQGMLTSGTTYSMQWDGLTKDGTQADASTYTYDIVIEEYVNMGASNPTTWFSYKFPYCSTMGNHCIHALDNDETEYCSICRESVNDISNESGSKLYFAYNELADLARQNSYPNEKDPTIYNFKIDILDEKFHKQKAVSLDPDNHTHQIAMEKNNESKSYFSYWRTVYTGQDECWMAYRRDHSESLMLAANIVARGIFNVDINDVIGANKGLPGVIVGYDPDNLAINALDITDYLIPRGRVNTGTNFTFRLTKDYANDVSSYNIEFNYSGTEVDQIDIDLNRAIADVENDVENNIRISVTGSNSRFRDRRIVAEIFDETGTRVEGPIGILITAVRPELESDQIVSYIDTSVTPNIGRNELILTTDNIVKAELKMPANINVGQLTLAYDDNIVTIWAPIDDEGPVNNINNGRLFTLGGVQYTEQYLQWTDAAGTPIFARTGATFCIDHNNNLHLATGGDAGLEGILSTVGLTIIPINGQNFVEIDDAALTILMTHTIGFLTTLNNADFKMDEFNLYYRKIDRNTVWDLTLRKLPQYIYIEGISAGNTDIRLEYDYDPTTHVIVTSHGNRILTRAVAATIAGATTLNITGRTVNVGTITTANVIELDMRNLTDDGIVLINIHDNEEKSKDKNSEQFTVFSISTTLPGGAVTVTLPSGVTDDNGSSTISFNLNRGDTFSQDIILEGNGVSDHYKDRNIRLVYNYNNKDLYTKEIPVTLVDFDLSLESSTIYVNSDDDDNRGDGVQDKDRAGIVYNEDDLVGLNILIKPFDLPVGNIEGINKDSDVIKFFKSSVRGGINAGSDQFSMPIADILPKGDIYLEAVAESEDKEKIVVTYKINNLELSKSVDLDVLSPAGGNDVVFKVLKSNPFDTNDTEDIKGKIGSKVYVVAVVTVKSGNYVSTTQDDLNVLIKDKWSGYDENTRAQSDYPFDIDSGWREYSIDVTNNITWGAPTALPQTANALDRVYYKIIGESTGAETLPWNTETGPRTEYMVNGDWQDVGLPLGHNGEHNISLINGDGTTTQGVRFESGTTSNYKKPNDRNVNIDNLSINSATVTSSAIANENYFVYKSGKASKYRRPQLKYSFSDTNLDGNQHTYQVTWVIWKADDINVELGPNVDNNQIKANPYATVTTTHDSPGSYTLTWDGNNDLADWGIYTYDILIEEYIGTEELVSSWDAYKWPYCSIVQDQTLTAVNITPGSELKYSYNLVDSCVYTDRQSITDSEIILYDNDFIEQDSIDFEILDGILVLNELVEDITAHSNTTNESYFYAGWSVIYTGKDECWEAYRRNHKINNMLTASSTESGSKIQKARIIVAYDDRALTLRPGDLTFITSAFNNEFNVNMFIINTTLDRATNPDGSPAFFDTRFRAEMQDVFIDEYTSLTIAELNGTTLRDTTANPYDNLYNDSTYFIVLRGVETAATFGVAARDRAVDPNNGGTTWFVARLHDENYSQIVINTADVTDPDLLRNIITHEIGHALNLVQNRDNGMHCSDRDCIMYKQFGFNAQISTNWRPVYIESDVSRIWCSIYMPEHKYDVNNLFSPR